MYSDMYGYARVSSKDQNEARQIVAMNAIGIKKDHIYMDKQSGKDFERAQYLRMLNTLKKGDTLVVTSLDRLGRNYEEMLEQWWHITKKIGADIRVLDMPLLDTSQGKELIEKVISSIVLQLSSFMSQNERDAIRRRQAEGIAAAKERGVRFGRPIAPLPEEFESLYNEWRTGAICTGTACEIMGVSRSSFYRMVHKYEDQPRCITQ